MSKSRLSKWEIFSRSILILELFAIVAALFGLYVVYLELNDMQINRKNQAWQILTTKAPGNSGKRAALEYLNSTDKRWFGTSQREILASIDLSDVNGKPVWLHNVDLAYAGLYHANFTKAQMLFSNLYNATLVSANLTNTDLNLSCLKKTDFSKAIMTKTELGLSDLTEAKFNDVADLTGAKFGGANLSGATFTGAKNIDKADFDSTGNGENDGGVKAWFWSTNPPTGIDLTKLKSITSNPPRIYSCQ